MRAHAPTRFGLTLAEALYVGLSACFAVVLVLTNVVGTKLFQIFPDGRPTWLPGQGPLVLSAGVLTYPLTFLLTDVVAELWGKSRADLMVVLGFVMNLLMVLVLQLAVPLPPADLWTHPGLGLGPADMQRAYQATFAYPSLLLAASMLAYLCAQLFDVRLYHFWWRLTRGRHMWIRNNGSTLISQIVDTTIVNALFLPLAFGLGAAATLEIIAASYAAKALLALLDTPLLYLLRAGLRRLLQIPYDPAPTRAPLDTAA